MKLCVENFKLTEKYILCHKLLLIFFIKFFYCPRQNDQIFTFFIIELKGSIQKSCLRQDTQPRSCLQLDRQFLSITTLPSSQNSPCDHLHMLRNTRACKDHNLILPLFICRLWTLQEFAGAPWASMCALNRPNKFWQQGWTLPGGQLVEVGIAPISPTLWVILELSLENLRNHNGRFLSASSHWCRTALARKNTKYVKCVYQRFRELCNE